MIRRQLLVTLFALPLLLSGCSTVMESMTGVVADNPLLKTLTNDLGLDT
jgi:uncharacterized protein YceK